MSATTNAPIIIRRKKVIAGDGHHGGAWKVAYADFVTAMMAFFMLMWLLNATTEQQRKGLADYFNPAIPLAKISGGGDGMMNGQDMLSDEAIFRNGAYGLTEDAMRQHLATAEENRSFEQLHETLLGSGGESLEADNLLRHVSARITDEGLVIELTDDGDRQLFHPDSATPTALAEQLALTVLRSLEGAGNDIAITAHVRSQPIITAKRDVWALSVNRADRFRDLMERKGLGQDRIARATGRADREPISSNPLDIRNNRIQIVLLRELF